MKITYFTESLPPNTDGVSHTLVRLSEYLQSQQVDFRFVSPFKPSNGHYLSDQVRKVRSIPFPMYSAYKMGMPYFHNLYEYLDDFDPDLIHVVSPTLLCRYGIQYGRRRGLPIVGTYHTHFVAYFKYYGFGRFESLGWKYLRWFYNQCDVTYVPSPEVQGELRSQGVENVMLLPHGIDTNRFSPAYRSQELRRQFGADDSPILLFVGRLVKEKDLADLIDVNRILGSRGYEFTMVFVGDGPMRDDLESALPNAHFTGTLAGESLSRWYASADVFLFPSTTETFGLVVQESFASAVPVVGVRASGVINLVDDGKNGYLTNPNDPEGMAERVGYLLERPQLRHQLGENARQKTESRSWDKVNHQLLEDYQAMVTPGSDRNGSLAVAVDEPDIRHSDQ